MDPLANVGNQLARIEMEVGEGEDINDLDNDQIDRIRGILGDLSRQLRDYAQNPNAVDLRNRIEAVEARLAELAPVDFNEREEEDADLEPMAIDERRPGKRDRVREDDEGADIGEGDRKRPKIDEF